MFKKVLLFLIVPLLFVSCENKKTFDQIIKDGRKTFISDNEWRLRFEKTTSENDKLKENISKEYSVFIENVTDSKKYEVLLREIDFSMDSLMEKESKSIEMSFSEFEKFLKEMKKEFLTENDIETIQRKNPNLKIKTSGSCYAVRRAKANEYDEISSNQTIVYMGKNNKKETIINFSFEKIFK